MADIISFPWAMLIGPRGKWPGMLDGNVWERFPNLKRWVDDIRPSPAVD